MTTLKNLFLILISTVTIAGNGFASEIFADSHIHFNWDHIEETSAQEIIDTLKQHNVGLAIVASTPSHLALELREQGGEWIIPFYSPYTHALGKQDWYLNKDLVDKVEQALASGHYYGIGEVHFMAGFRPNTDNVIFLQLLSLAKKYNVPVLIHIDSANELTFKHLCLANSDIKMIFAHAGGNLGPGHIENILSACNNVWIDFAARDPWRYDGISKQDHTLLAEWKTLVLAYPDRFITGTDPVWKVTRGQTWDSGDEGWTHYQKLYDYHWAWLNDLPENVRKKIAWKNTQTLLQQ